MKASAKILTDILMFFLLLFLMAACHTGSAAHEWLGVLLAAVFLLHTWLNRVWYKNLGKGSYRAARSVQLLLNLLLLLAAAGTLASAVPLSRTVFAFTGFKGELSFRTFHVFCAHWCFILAAAHLGLYAKRFFSPIERLFFYTHACGRKPASVCTGIIFAAYGIHAFLQRELIYPLTLRSSFMLWSENTALFLLDYSAVFFLCAWTVSIFSSLAHRWSAPACAPDISKKQ